MNKKYMKYLWEERKPLFLVLGVIGVLLCLPSLLSHQKESAYAGVLVTLSIYAWILAIVLGPVFLNYVHSRKACDRMFALPFKRKDMLVSTLITVDSGILVPYIALTVLMGILGRCGYLHGDLPVLYTALNCLFSSLGVIFLTAFSGAVYLLAGSTLDGIVTVSGYFCMPFVLSLALILFQTENVAGGFSPIDLEPARLSLPYLLYEIMDTLLDGRMLSVRDTLTFIVTGIGHVVFSGLLLKYNYINRKTERAEHISDHPLSYRFLLAAYCIILTFMVSTFFVWYKAEGDIFTPVILYVLIFIFYTIMCFIYRRRIALSRKALVLFIAAIIVSIGFNALAFRTKCFGLVYNYTTGDLPIRYYYYENDSAVMDGLLKEKGAHWQEYTVEFEMILDEENDEVETIMENSRKTGIAGFYALSDTEHGAYLDIQEGYDRPGLDIYKVCDEECSYSSAGVLSLEDLMKINEVTEVQVFSCDPVDDGQASVYTLDELLNQ